MTNPVTAVREDRAARAWIRGSVRLAETGPPIAGASVSVLSARGDTVAMTQTDSGGLFALQVHPEVGYRAVASGEGYLQEATTPFTLEGAATGLLRRR